MRALLMTVGAVICFAVALFYCAEAATLETTWILGRHVYVWQGPGILTSLQASAWIAWVIGSILLVAGFRLLVAAIHRA